MNTGRIIEWVNAIGFIALLLAIAIPNYVKARANSSQSACIANLKQIQGAKATWARENKQPPTAVPTEADLYGPNRYIRTTPVCPADGTYRLGAVGEKTTCSLGATLPSHRLPSDL